MMLPIHARLSTVCCMNPAAPVKSERRPLTLRKMSCTRCIFSDLDGTIVHYPSLGSLKNAAVDDVLNANLISLPPSLSGSQGIISAGTLRLFGALRSLGVKVVLISGARSATLLQRLPYLPAADAYVCENGGRIFLSDSMNLRAAPVTEDMEWRKQHEATAGPSDQDAVPPAQRSGTLWQLYAALETEGWQLDAVHYTTSFRVKVNKSNAADMERLRLRVPAGLCCASNLGSVDYFPATSGKEKAARYLMQQFGVPAAESVFLCDDDNDLQLAAAVRKAYLPAITAPSVHAAIKADPKQFYVSKEREWHGTEEILKELLQEQLAGL